MRLREETSLTRQELSSLRSLLGACVQASHASSSKISRAWSRTVTSSQDPFFSAALKRSHAMWVVPVRTLLSPSFTFFRPHEEMRAANMLAEYHESMSGCMMFISHAWLRTSHPDNEAGVKFRLLRTLLQRIVQGTLDIKTPWMVTEIVGRKSAKNVRIKAARLKRDLADGFVFFDYMSIPQRNPNAQKHATASLVSYITASAYFLVCHVFFL